MAIYYCQGCDRFVDDDEAPMSELELCPECEASREDDEDNPKR